MHKAIALTAVAAIITGCTSAGRITTDISPSTSESVFVIGLEPQNYRISVFPGKINDGRFELNAFLNAAFYGSAQGGYIIGKAAAGRDLAITNVRIVETESSILGADFQPCEEAKTVAFTAPAGRVVYLGHLSYLYGEGGLRVAYRQDMESAKAHLQTIYPNLAASLEQGSYDLLPVARPCGSTTVIPVYVPAMK